MSVFLFIISLVCLLISLCYLLRELLISIKALSLELDWMEKNKSYDLFFSLKRYQEYERFQYILESHHITYRLLFLQYL